MTAGYYRFPTIYQDTIVFVSEDDLWTVPRQGGIARRLTSNLGEVNSPSISIDGEWLAFVGREEGRSEVYLMPAGGGSARRLTYLNSACQVLGWSLDGRSVIFASTHHQVHHGVYGIFSAAMDAANGAVQQLSVGTARSIAFRPNGAVVIGRGLGDPARWKRYRGGTAGHLWIDCDGNGQFVRLLADLRGNIASPMWLGDRLYFVSDHEGIGNLYSCTAAGDDLRRHTDHEDFYVRNPSSDGRRIVYHAGADLFVYDPASARSELVAVDWRSPRVQRNRKFVSASAYLEQARLRPQGDALALITRGKSYSFYSHEGPVLQLGKRDGVRYRLPDWMNDGRHVLVVDDAAGEEELAIYSMMLEDEPRRLPGLDIGRPIALRISPREDKVAISNHRNEMLMVDLQSGALTVLDRSEWRPIAGFDWSPDGRWLAYGFGTTLNTTEVRIIRVGDVPGGQPIDGEPPIGQPVAVTRPILHDLAPSFDPEGKYLYFLSYREFNPVYDTLQFDLGFPWGMRPYLVTLRADLPNPFVPQPDEEDEFDEDEPRDSDDDDHDDDSSTAGEDEDDDSEGEEEDGADGEEDDIEDDSGDDDDDSEEGDEEADDDSHELDEEAKAGGREYRIYGSDLYGRRQRVRHLQDADVSNPSIASSKHASSAEERGKNEANDRRAKVGEKNDKQRKPLLIDLEGIERRVLAFPVPDGRYGQIAGAPGRVLYTSFPVRGALEDEGDLDDDREAQVGALRAWVFKDYKSESMADNVNSFELSRNRKKLVYFSSRRLRVIAAGEKAPSDSGPGRKSGWIDLSRVKVSVRPQSEWEQMYREAWRLQRDHFWTEDMAEVDWRAVYERYLPLIARVSTRSEFSDLVWEMQGELGSSHAYELGGDYRSSPHYSQGVLAADVDWDAEAQGYRIRNIVVGDSWEEEGSSPLAGPGIDVRDGDVLLAINGQRLDAETSPAQLLVNQAGNEVLLTLSPRPGKDEPGNDGEDKGNTDLRHEIVRAIHDDGDARYRAWVEANRRRVHEMTGGRIGYLHIPDMGPQGYAEFHRGFLAEVTRDGLVVDVRFNGGGNVSPLLLEKLARRRIGYDKSRWGGISPYPSESLGGPVVALTNEYAGSDGDIFCHSFKLLKLGPLIGKRTWGGVIGISPRYPLVDGTITTQPEFSYWFDDVGWTVENYGTDPDIEVDMTPQDQAAGRDPQLERAVTEAMRLLADRPQVRPDLASRPSRALPRLPRRAAEDAAAEPGADS